MQNIGPGPLSGALRGVTREARKGLVTTVGYKLRNKPACYAIEGSVKIAGAALTWLRDNLQLINDYSECDELVNKTAHSAGVFFVPAFGGLYSPYWDPNASGLFIGLSQFSRREHLVRATFDSIAFQTNDILNLMRGVTNGLMIDGGLCESDSMCQILADITGCEIVRPAMTEISALGAAMVAGHGAGLWSQENMIARSNSRFGYSCSTHQTHHYPHRALHYEDKFSKIISTMQAESITGNHRLRSESTVDHPSCDGSSPSFQSEIESETGSIIADLECDVRYSSAQGDNLLGSVAAAQGDTYYKTSSSGYNSADNYDAATNSACDLLRITPISSQITSTTDKASDRFENESSSKEGDCSQVVNGGAGTEDQVVECNYDDDNNRQQLACTFPDSYASPYTDYELDRHIKREAKSTEGDLRDVGSPDIDRNLINRVAKASVPSLSSSVDATSQADNDDKVYSDLDSNKPMSKITDVFQSYISLEHRTELVNTWRRAIERSMKWTKVDHEEIRRIDYQRMSSLPLSIYLFFSVGIFALSEILSGRIIKS